MTGLIHWLVDRRRAGTEAEEAQLRLESDENLVKIATVHKSKGLEYPIVFCPFLWDGRIYADQADALSYHDPRANHRPTLDLGSARHGEAKAQARREELADSLRLAYVALTRAKHRCYAVWGHVRDGATAPLAYLLHQPTDLGDDPMGAVEAHVGSLGAADIRADLDRLAQASGGTIAVGTHSCKRAQDVPGSPDGTGYFAGPHLRGPPRRALADHQLLGAHAGVRIRSGLAR